MSSHAAPVYPVMFGPNITGSFRNPNANLAGFLSDEYADDLYYGGAFYKYSTGKQYSNNNNEIYDNMLTGLGFSASYSSSAYGNSSAVQPASLRLIHCIKF